MTKLNLSDGEVIRCLEEHYRSKDFKLLKWKVISFNEEGKLGYAGDHFRVETTVQRGSQEENASFFVKTIPANKLQQDLVKAAGMVKKEYLFYKDVANRMISILSKARPFVGDSKVSVIPQCLLAREDLLLLEDLRVAGFQGKDADKPLPLSFFLICVRALARFHAASIAWEEELGKPLQDNFPDMDFEAYLNPAPDHCLAGWHAASLHAARQLIPMVEKYKDKPEIVKKTQDALPELISKMMASARAWPDTKNVFCHGDMWVNNVVFRLDEGGEPLEAVLVDYQLLRYAPPATDLVMFLLFSSGRQFRTDNTEVVLREYHTELGRTLLDFGIDTDKVLPWEELLRTCKELQKHMLVLMTMEYPLALAPSELMDPILKDDDKYIQHFKVNRTPLCIKMFQENEKFRTRYTEVVEELIDNYIVNI